MPAKMSRSAPRPPFGPPEVTVAVRTYLARMPEISEYPTQFGCHLGNPELCDAHNGVYQFARNWV
jgi:hypothetical protein